MVWFFIMLKRKEFVHKQGIEKYFGRLTKKMSFVMGPRKVVHKYAQDWGFGDHKKWFYKRDSRGYFKLKLSPTSGRCP